MSLHLAVRRVPSLLKIVVGAMLCCLLPASALAEKPVKYQRHQAQVQTHRAVKIKRVCLVMCSASAIPTPCDRVKIPIPTTATAIQVFGNGY